VSVLAYAAAVTLLAWAVLTLQFVGLGLLALRAVGHRPALAEDGFTAFWLGFAVSIAHLQIVSLFLPVSVASMVPLIGVSLVGFAANRNTLVDILRWAGRSRAKCATIAALCPWAAVYAQSPLRVYDAGIYHLGSIRWASTYPVLPGLGNLGPAYGLNSSAFLYLAAASVANVNGFHIALGLLVLVLLIEVSLLASRLLKRNDARRSQSETYLAALLVLPILVMAGTAGFSTTIYDIVNFVLAIIISRQLLDLLGQRQIRPTEALPRVFTIACLASAAITSKISIAVFSAATVSLAMVAAYCTTRSRRASVAYLAIVIVPGIVVVGPWLLRNTILTGYPLYPDPSLALTFDWSMPVAQVRGYRDVLYDFARLRGEQHHAGASRTLEWMSPWLRMSWRDVLAPGLFAAATPIAVFVGAPGLTHRLGRRWLVLVPIWLGLVAWFVTAPDPRYAGSLLWLAAAVPVAFLLPSLGRAKRLTLLVLFCAGVEMPNGGALLALVELPAAALQGQFTAADDIPRVPLTVFTTVSGLRVFVPDDGGDQVWDAPLPSTPYPNTALRLRCPDTLACGFATQP